MVEGWEMNGREGKEGGVCGEEGNGECRGCLGGGDGGVWQWITIVKMWWW